VPLALQIWLRRFSMGAQVAVCLTSLMVMLTLPAPRPHRFLDHFRPSDLGRQAQRHSFLVQSINHVCEKIVACYREPGKLPVLRPQDRSRPVIERGADAAVPLTRLFLRHKLGISSRPPEDPLI